MLLKSSPGRCESWPRRSLRIGTNKGQCRKKCALSSTPVLQAHIGLVHWKLCRNLCSFNVLNSSLSIVSCFTPSISNTPNKDFFNGLIRVSNLRLNSGIVAEFLTFSSSSFHSWRTFVKYVFEERFVPASCERSQNKEIRAILTIFFVTTLKIWAPGSHVA